MLMIGTEILLLGKLALDATRFRQASRSQIGSRTVAPAIVAIRVPVETFVASRASYG